MIIFLIFCTWSCSHLDLVHLARVDDDYALLTTEYYSFSKPFASFFGQPCFKQKLENRLIFFSISRGHDIVSVFLLITWCCTRLSQTTARNTLLRANLVPTAVPLVFVVFKMAEGAVRHFENHDWGTRLVKSLTIKCHVTVISEKYTDQCGIK